LFLITDQQRYDAIGRVQHELAAYNGTLKVRTPNLDRLSQDGAYVRTVYTQCPVCGPARTSLRTGCTIERTGVQTNPLTDNVNNLNRKLFQEKIR
jgi:arylsulfatase A-like enzyme